QSSIDVSAKGLLGEPGTGIYSGGSHGGLGGNHMSGTTPLASGGIFGDYRQPSLPGRGGRSNTSNNAGDVIRGGGVIKVVADSLVLNGKILADGESVLSNL